MQRKLLALLIALSLAPASWAVDLNPQPTAMTVFCPPPDAIKKDPTKLTWHANRNTFRSYDISFSTSVARFTGAQWNGANVGQITCIYEMLPKPSFPLLLIFHTLTDNPKGGAWGKNLGGYKNCNSLDRKKCAFNVRLKPKAGNIYQEAESLKSTAPEPPNE